MAAILLRGIWVKCKHPHITANLCLFIELSCFISNQIQTHTLLVCLKNLMVLGLEYSSLTRWILWLLIWHPFGTIFKYSTPSVDKWDNMHHYFDICSRWIPLTKGQLCRNRSHVMTSLWTVKFRVFVVNPSGTETGIFFQIIRLISCLPMPCRLVLPCHPQL